MGPEREVLLHHVLSRILSRSLEMIGLTSVSFQYETNQYESNLLQFCDSTESELKACNPSHLSPNFEQLLNMYHLRNILHNQRSSLPPLLLFPLPLSLNTL